jgi:hypothetical protein
MNSDQVKLFQYHRSRLLCIAVYVKFEGLVVLVIVFGTCKLGLL